MDVSRTGDGSVSLIRLFPESPTKVVSGSSDSLPAHERDSMIPSASQNTPELYMHQSADRILVVIVLMFVTCVLVMKHNVIY